MKIRVIEEKGVKIAELVSENILITGTDDGTDLVGNLYFEGFEKAILYKENISENFFDLKTGIAGEILQKFSNYRIRLAIVGDFSMYESKSLHDFIHESNKTGLISFAESRPLAIELLSKS